MKASRSATHRKSYALPALQFEQQRLTSFAGLVIFQKLFAALRIRERLRACFAHLGIAPIFGFHTVFLSLVLHLLLGYRELRDIRFYRDDPMIKRVLGLRRLPDVATISRVLAAVDARAVRLLRALCRALCLDRLAALALARITLDFDGSVLSTMRQAEGTAVGYTNAATSTRGAVRPGHQLELPRDDASLQDRDHPGTAQEDRGDRAGSAAAGLRPEDLDVETVVVVMMENRSFDPTWARCRCMIVVTYDEHGGFYDHVPPPTVEDERAADGFGQLGFRVPSFVISPYTRRGNVSSMLHEHASVPAFLGWLLGLEPLTVRDANANFLLDTFDVDRVRRPDPRPAPALPVLQVDPEPVLECLELWVGEAAGQVELASFAERAGLAHLDRRARNWERLANVRRTLVELGGAVVRR